MTAIDWTAFEARTTELTLNAATDVLNAYALLKANGRTVAANAISGAVREIAWIMDNGHFTERRDRVAYLTRESQTTLNLYRSA